LYVKTQPDVMHANHPSMRTGWYFLPSRALFCRIEFFTDSELRQNPHEKSIYILGSSKERGVFLSLVDMLLDSKEKEHLNDSVIAKCWGRAFVLKNNLKVFYQDWRSKYFEHRGAPTDYLCHNEKMIREGGSQYTENGITVWHEIFADRSSWPNVIMMSLGDDEGFHGQFDLKYFIQSLPTAWKGKLLLTDGAFSAKRAGNGNEKEYKEYRKFIRDLVAGLQDSRVLWMDGKGLSKDQRMYSEGGPNSVTGSQHFHSMCQSSYLDESGQQQSMKICSNVTEVLAQLMLGYALGPKAEYTELTQNNASLFHGNKEAMYCHACPEELLPFHITPNPEMTCAVGALHPRSRTEADKSSLPKLCPEACLDNPPMWEIQTQSGVVIQRSCPMKYFLQPVGPVVENLDQMAKDVEQMKREQNQLVLQEPPIIENDRIMSELENQALHKGVRSGDLLHIRSEETSSNVFLPQDEVEESFSSFFYNIWMLNLGFVVILTAVRIGRWRRWGREWFGGRGV
jgi:hypothetical protein